MSLIFGSQLCSYYLFGSQTTFSFQIILVLFFSSISTVSCIDELAHHDDNARMAVSMENTYQLGEIMFMSMTNTAASSPTTCNSLIKL